MATQSQNRSSSVAAFVLRLPDHQKELHQYIWQLFDNDLHTDVALALDDGKHIKAHKLILSAFSPYFRQVLTCVSTPYQYPVIIVKDMVYEDLRSLIEFIYKGSTTVSKERLPQVLRCAKDLKIRGLYETNIDREHYDYHRNEPRITQTIHTIAPTISETIETLPQNCCNSKFEEKETIFVDRNSNICNVKEEEGNEWSNKKLSPNPNPANFISPKLINMQQKIALDLSKRMANNSDPTQIPVSAFNSVPHPSLLRSTSVDDCQFNKNKILMSIKHKRAPSSLDGHLDSSKIENEYSPVCRKEKKRNLNIFHAAKYRNRKKQQLETLFQEENELQKRNIQAKVQIEKLESTILTLIWQQTKKTFNSQTVFSCPVCGNVQKEVARLRSHINMLHNDTEALMKFLMLQRSPTITSTITSASTSSTSVPFRVNSN